MLIREARWVDGVRRPIAITVKDKLNFDRFYDGEKALSSYFAINLLYECEIVLIICLVLIPYNIRNPNLLCLLCF